MPEDLRKKRQSSKSGREVRLIPQARDIRLFEALSKLRIIDRTQAELIGGFHSLTRVNSRLAKLTRAGLLKRFFFVSIMGGKKAVYSLTSKSAGMINTTPNDINRPTDSFLIGDRFTAHQLAIGDIYCAAAYTEKEEKTLQDFRIFSAAIPASIPFTPDAYLEISLVSETRPLFLEVDLGTEGLPLWTQKIKQYLNFALTGEFEKLFKRSRFGVLVIANSERRMLSLLQHVKKSTSKIFFFATLEAVRKEGFWSAIWYRPEGGRPQSLI